MCDHPHYGLECLINTQQYCCTAEPLFFISWYSGYKITYGFDQSNHSMTRTYTLVTRPQLSTHYSHSILERIWF